MPPLLSDAECQALWVKIPLWQPRDATAMRRTYQWKGFLEAMVFVNQVAELAESINHHPDMCIRWNQVELTLSTHSQGGLTELDFQLAEQCDALAQSLLS